MNSANESNARRPNRWLVKLVLIGVLVGEGLLVWSLRRTGWNGTLSSLGWLGAGALAMGPLVIAALLLCWSGRRFRLRTLLIVFALLAVFLSISVRPVLRYKQDRRASHVLNVNGIKSEFHRNIIDYDAVSSGEFQPKDSVGWLGPFVRDYAELLPDRDIRSVEVTSDDQCRLLISQFDSLPNLYHVQIWGGSVTNDSLAMLTNEPRIEAISIIATSIDPNGLKRLKKADHLRYLMFANMPEVLSFDTILPCSLHTLFIRDESGNDHWMNERHLEVISRLTSLETLFLSGYNIIDSDVPPLGSLNNLRYLSIANSLTGKDAELQLSAALPSCEVYCGHYQINSEAWDNLFASNPSGTVIRLLDSIGKRLTQLMASRGLDSRDSDGIWRNAGAFDLIDELVAEGYLTKEHRARLLELRVNAVPPYQDADVATGINDDLEGWYESAKQILFGLERKLDPTFDPYADAESGDG